MRTDSAIKLVNTNDPVYNKLTVGEDGNRIPTDRSVMKLATSIGNCNLLKYRPILVKSRGKKKQSYTIVDGQTRYLACQHLGVPFYMQELDKDITEGMLSILNTNQNNWTLTNFGDYWASQPRKKKTYTKYMEYYRDNDVTHGILLSIWREQHRRTGNNQDFKEGKLQWNSQIQNHVEDMLHKFKRLKYATFNPPLTPSTVKKQTFQSAMLTALHTKEFDYNKFLKNLYDNKHLFNKLGKTTAFLEEIYRIENL